MNKKELKNKTINNMMSEPKKLINGLITIGYDFTKDHCCLIVAKPRGKDELMIINEFYGDEANELFIKLIGDSNE